MTVTITRLNGDSRFDFTVTSLRARIEDTADAAVRYIYPIRWQLFTEDEEPLPIPYNNLTNTQKLNVLNQELIAHLKAMARSGFVTDTGDAAREVAQEKADTKFNIDN